MSEALPLNTAIDIISTVEAEHFVESLRPFPPCEVGTTAWKEQRVHVEQLNQASHVCAQSKRDDYVLSALVTHGKLPVLLHELLVCEAMRIDVYSKHARAMAQAPAAMYMYAYYESIIVNFFSCIMYHEEAVLGFDDDLPELIDYCWRSCAVTLLSDRDSSSETTEITDPKKILELPEEQRVVQQMHDLDVSRALSCVSCLWFIVDRINSLCLAAVNAILTQADLVTGFAQLLDAEPWVRRSPSSSIQKFINGAWAPVSRQDALLLCIPEAHCWFALRMLLCDRQCRNRYQYNQFRKNIILRVKRRINETIVDQIPALTDLQRALEELSFLEPPTGTEEKFKTKLLIEQVPRIRTAVHHEMKGAEASFLRMLTNKELAMEDAHRLSRLIDALMGGEMPTAGAAE